MIPFLLILLIIALALLAGGYIAFYLAIVRRPPKPGYQSAYLQQFLPELERGAQWFRDQSPETVCIHSHDKLRLTGYFLPAENAKGTLLLVHGYRSNPMSDFGIVCPFYHSLGWNILAVCQRAHGESEGKYITFGVKERFDVCDWALYLADRFGPDHAIVLDGISMGSASVLMSLGTQLPPNVKCAIADCGFTNAHAQFVHLLKTRIHLPAHPLLDIAQLFAKLFADFDFKAYSTLDALHQTKIPVLFIHGERDTYVHVRFTVENYGACASEKKLFAVPEAGHGTSYIFAREACQQTLREFLETHVKTGCTQP